MRTNGRIGSGRARPAASALVVVALGVMPGAAGFEAPSASTSVVSDVGVRSDPRTLAPSPTEVPAPSDAATHTASATAVPTTMAALTDTTSPTDPTAPVSPSDAPTTTTAPPPTEGPTPTDAPSPTASPNQTVAASDAPTSPDPPPAADPTGNDPTPFPTTTVEPTQPVIGPTTDPTTDPTMSSLPLPIPVMSAGGVDETAVANPASSAPAPVTTTDLRTGTDGIGPDAGQVDAYLALTDEQTRRTAQVSTLQAAAITAHTLVHSLETQQSLLAMTYQVDLARAARAQVNTDAVAAQLYQQGDSGLWAVGAVDAGTPEGLLLRLDLYARIDDVANDIAHQAVSAQADLALVAAQQSSLSLRLASARDAETAAVLKAADAQAELSAIKTRLDALTAAAPQVTIGVDGCPRQNVPSTLRDGSVTIGAAALCRAAVQQAATPQAALAITWAFQHLGAAYACGGAGRLLPFRADCSSFVSRAYHEGAGLATAGAGWAPTTRDMVPWGGAVLDSHYAYVNPGALRPGDLVLYDTCPQGGCAYKHVVMYLGSLDGGKTQWMIHTNSCGDIAKVESFWGFPTTGHPFLVGRRVVALPGETVSAPTRAPPVSP